MAKTIKITLGDQEYEVPRLIIEQVEELAGLWENSDADGNFLKGKALVSNTIELARIVLRYATPAIIDMRRLDCGISDLQAACGKVLDFTQLTRSAPEGNAPAGAAAPP